MAMLNYNMRTCLFPNPVNWGLAGGTDIGGDVVLTDGVAVALDE